jgi:hypothetical protein
MLKGEENTNCLECKTSEPRSKNTKSSQNRVISAMKDLLHRSFQAILLLIVLASVHAESTSTGLCFSRFFPNQLPHQQLRLQVFHLDDVL